MATFAGSGAAGATRALSFRAGSNQIMLRGYWRCRRRCVMMVRRAVGVGDGGRKTGQGGD